MYTYTIRDQYKVSVDPCAPFYSIHGELLSGAQLACVTREHKKVRWREARRSLQAFRPILAVGLVTKQDRPIPSISGPVTNREEESWGRDGEGRRLYILSDARLA